MNSAFRFAALAVAAFLFSLTANVVFAAPADQMAVRWSDLHSALKGRQVLVSLTDGATVEGRYSSVQAGALSILVTKTSDPAKHATGAVRLARPEVAQITLMRHRGWRGRTIGLIVGGAIATLVVGTVSEQMANKRGCCSTASAAAIAAAGGGGAIGIGYAIGWARDSAGSRPEQIVRILPDEVSR